MRNSDQLEEESRQWQQLLDGEQHALAFFYEKYADWLLKYGLSIVYNREMVQDAVQELFIQVWNRRTNLTVPLSVKYYMMASLRRIILKDISSSRLLTDSFPADTLLAESPYSPDVDETEEATSRVLQAALRALPPRQQEVIFLRFFDKLSYEEITALTCLDNQVLRNTIFRATKTLKQALINKIELLLPFLLMFFI